METRAPVSPSMRVGMPLELVVFAADAAAAVSAAAPRKSLRDTPIETPSLSIYVTPAQRTGCPSYQNMWSVPPGQRAILLVQPRRIFMLNLLRSVRLTTCAIPAIGLALLFTPTNGFAQVQMVSPTATFGGLTLTSSDGLRLNITNVGNQPFTITAAWAMASGGMITSPQVLTIPAGDTFSLNLTW